MFFTVSRLPDPRLPEHENIGNNSNPLNKSVDLMRRLSDYLDK